MIRVHVENTENPGKAATERVMHVDPATPGLILSLGGGLQIIKNVFRDVSCVDYSDSAVV